MDLAFPENSDHHADRDALAALAMRSVPVSLSIYRAERDARDQVDAFSSVFANAACFALARQLIPISSEPDRAAIRARTGRISVDDDLHGLFQSFMSVLSGDAPHAMHSYHEGTTSRADRAAVEIVATRIDDDNLVSLWLDTREARQAETTARAAAETAHEQRQFLSLATHELRTPLNAILGFAQLLRLDELSNEQREATQQIVDGGQHLLRLIDEILQVAELDGEVQVTCQPLRVVAIARRAVELLRPIADVKGVTIGFDCRSNEEAAAYADSTRLNQILYNLITNAISYNRSGGHVEVVVESAPTHTWISVNDDGPGLVAEELAAAFTPFTRFRPGAAPGMGLGLPIASRLAELMDGELTAASTPDVGSSFRIGLKTAKYAVGLDPLAVADTPVLGGVAQRNFPSRILIVEDVPSSSRLLTMALARYPEIHLVYATTGTAAVTQARSTRPDVILLDLCLPDMSGEEVIHSLRNDPLTKAGRIVAISASADPIRRSQLEDLGVDAYLRKPVDLEEFFSCLASVMGGASPAGPRT